MSGNTSSFAKFVSQKVNKIRWKPKANQFIVESKEFATGSWDNEVVRTFQSITYCSYARCFDHGPIFIVVGAPVVEHSSPLTKLKWTVILPRCFKLYF